MAALAAVLLAAAAAAEEASPAPPWRLLAHSAAAARAVVDLGEGRLVVVGPGDALGDGGPTVVRVLVDRLEVAEAAGGGAGGHHWWIYPARGATPSRAVLVDRTAPPAPPRAAPSPVVAVPQGAAPPADAGGPR